MGAQSDPAKAADLSQTDTRRGIAGRAVDHLKRKLLDLSLRNRLLNFRHSPTARNHVRLVDEVPEFLFGRLAEGATLAFRAVDLPEQEPEDERQPAFLRLLDRMQRSDAEYIAAKAALGARPRKARVRQIERDMKNRARTALGLSPWESPVTPEAQARSLGIDPAYDLPPETDSPQRNHLDDRIQTLHFPPVLEAKLNAIRDAARTLTEDAGIAALYCGFGFLEWYEAPDSSEPHYAPLVLFPVDIQRRLDGGLYIFDLIGRDGDVETNLALAEKLREDFAMELPSWEEDTTLGSYFKSVARTVRDRDPRWRIRRWVTAGLFTFDRLVMYRDLSDALWPVGGGPQDHEILKRIFAGDDHVEPATYASDYDVDSPEARKLLPHLVADADTSQHSALLDVATGRSLVIQGPPGTGKSQTITNIISTALGEGKSVLFVAEKMAALDVVHKRLAAAGLGHFCLELHSHKTNKSEVLASIRQRRDQQEPRQGRVSLDEALAARERARASLTHYVARMNDAAGDTRMTVHELLWGCRARESALDNGPMRLLSIRLPNALGLTPHQRADIEECARILEGAQQRLAQWGHWSKQPWRGVQNRDLSFENRDNLLALLMTWRSCLARIRELSARIVGVCGCHHIQTPGSLRAFIAGLGRLQTPSRGVNMPLLVVCADASVCGSLRQVAEAQLEIGRLQKGIASAAQLDSVLGSPPDHLPRLWEATRANDCEDLSLSDLNTRSRDAQQKAKELGECEQLVGTLEHLWGAPLLDDALASLVQCIRITKGLPRLLLWKRDPRVTCEVSAPTLFAAAARAAELLAKERELAGVFLLASVPGPLILRDAEHTVRGASRWSPLFSVQYRRAMRLHHDLLRQPLRAKRSLVMEHFARLADHLERKARFLDDQSIAEACGDLFQGLQTDFDSLLVVADWAAKIRAATPLSNSVNEDIRHLFLLAKTEDVERLLGCGEHRAFPNLCRWLEGPVGPAAVPIRDETNASRSRSAALAGLAHDLAALGFRSQLPLVAVRDVATSLGKIRELSDRVASLSSACAAAGDHLRALSSEQVLDTARFAESTVSASVVAAVGTWVLRESMQGSFEKLQGFKEEGLAATEALDVSWRAVLTGLAIDPIDWCGAASVDDVPTSDLLARIDLAVAAPDAVDAMVTFLRAEDTAKALGLGEILRVFRDEDADYADLPAVFDACFYFSAAAALLKDDPDLRQYSGDAQEGLRKRFQQLDREVAEIGRKSLVARLLTRPVPEGNGKGPRGSWTEGALLDHQVSLQRRHLALRSLLGRAGAAIRALKPCFMMSPMSVAQYLAPEQPKFDLVVMDEASQMRPEDALGAILRGRQVVVVGDSQQLPPTTFFEKVDAGELDDEEGEELGIDGQESILDLTKACFGPLRTLNWHYRSRHDSLIAFSNREFYDGRLVVFPSPHAAEDVLGVQHVKVDGVYSKGRNQLEADKVVESVLQFIRQKGSWSLAVVTMNAAQREVLAQKLDAAFAADPIAEEYRSRWSSTLEPFAVKNLENVQGDERDAIFVSTVYGPDESGVFAQRFGPVNLAMGHRRLNVLFTRAKCLLRVFTSMSPEAIHTEGCSRGVTVLRDYLRFARDGSMPRDEGRTDEPENDFERWFAERLVANGYTVVPQYGVAGYRIDIAVRHPKHPGAFILGVECDGATYHSCRSARERDRLRQEVLEKLGWRLHRIWSTDWFRNPEREMELLLGKLADMAKRDLATPT